MSWNVDTIRDEHGTVTSHSAPGGAALEVEHVTKHEPGVEPFTHSVLLHNGNAPEGMLRWPTRQFGRDRAYLGNGEYGPPPSEQLRALIESHHNTHAWMPLLDKLAEEYPQLDAAVSAHTAARARA